MKHLEYSMVSKNYQTTVKAEVRAVAALDLKANDQIEWCLVEDGDRVEAGSVIVKKRGKTMSEQSVSGKSVTGQGHLMLGTPRSHDSGFEVPSNAPAVFDCLHSTNKKEV